MEEDADVRDALAAAMADAGAVVVVAADGAEALVQLRAGPLPSVILLDLREPRFGGEELLRALRADARFERVPVITMAGGAADGRDAVPRPHRPVDVADLRAIVLSLLDAAA